MKKLIILFLFCIVSVLGLSAQSAEKLPLDPTVRYGVLDNGLTYYIKHNEKPKDRCEFHIAQNVGAILEEDHQNGLAHFLEHMAFNGTKHYPKKGIINYMESIGVSFGKNINAYTSLDETVYRLSDVPTVREGIIDSALLVLHDWSADLLLEADEIDAERGVILEEWRTGATAMRRLWKASNQEKYPHSQYAKRDVIGDTAVINHFEYDALRSYYKKWYGPDLQAIVVVGDIDVDSIENKIKALWQDVPARSNRGERPIYPIHNNTEPIFSVVKDKEMPYSLIFVEYKHDVLPNEIKGSLPAYIINTYNKLISIILTERFAQIKQNPNASFVEATGEYGELVKSKDAFQFVAVPKEGSESAALYDLLLEIEKVARFGFSEAELSRAKANYISKLEKRYNERDARNNIDLTKEYIQHYLKGQCVPGLEWEYSICQQLMPALTLTDINKLVQSYISNNNMIISIMGMDKAGVTLPTKDDAYAMIAKVKTATLEAPQEEAIEQNLLSNMPTAGQIVSSKENAALGTTEWTLSNGVKVVLKPTAYKNDEILVHFFSEGGLSMVDRLEDLPSAALAADIISYNGVGDFSLTELQKVLSGKQLTIQPKITDYTEEVLGNSTIKDFETLLQLNYLYFTSVRQDDQAFQALMGLLGTVANNKENNPKAVFADSIQNVVSNHSPRSLLLNANLLKRVDQTKAIQFFKERFGHPEDFTFVFVGNIDPNSQATQELICRYIGGLKTHDKAEKIVDRDVRAPKGVTKNYFSRDMQIKTASNCIIYYTDMDYTLSNVITIQAIRDILYMRYTESIREREGGSYGVRVYSYVEQHPIGRASLKMQFDTGPDKQARLMEIIHEEIGTIVKEGPRADDFSKVKENMLKIFAENMEKNDYLRGRLYDYYVGGHDLSQYKAIVEALSPKDIQKLLKALVKANNVIEVVMLPK